MISIVEDVAMEMNLGGRDVPSLSAEARFSLLCRTSARSSRDCWRTERSLLCSSLFCGCMCVWACAFVWMYACECVYIRVYASTI